MDHSVGGRKEDQYSLVLAGAVLERLAAGWTVDAILAVPDMPCRRTLYDWRLRHPEFDVAWAEIRAHQAAARRRRLTAAEDSRAAREAARARHEGRPPRAKSGRKSTYTPDRAEAFCERLVEGFTLREIAALPGMPAVAMVYRWLRNHPEFRRAYVVALRMREELAADAVLEGRRPDRWTGGRPGQLRPDVWTEEW